jgi:hypothetical protein
LEKDFFVNPVSFENIPPHSCIFLDDFRFDPRQHNKTDFNEIINYTLRHNDIILFLITHNLVHSNLHTDILNSPHLFFSYSNVGDAIIR